MADLRIETPQSDAALEDWRHVHNTVIPTYHLSSEDVRERAGRHYLEVAYLDDTLVGCAARYAPRRTPSPPRS